MTTGTTFRDEIRATVSPWKFGGSRMAAMLYLLDLHGGADDCASLEGWGDYAARFGRHILRADSQGFVSAERYPTVADAERVMAELAAAWYGGEDEDA